MGREIQRETINFEGHQVEVRRKAYQKRLGVSVHPNGQIRVSANRSLSERKILQFLKKHKDWLEKSLDESRSLRDQHPPKKFETGELYPYLGQDYRLVIHENQELRLSFQENEIHFSVPDNLSTAESRKKYLKVFKKSYRQAAEQIMRKRVEIHSQRMGLVPHSVRLRDQKTIWGSCSPENKISLNFKLIVAPLEVIDYVVIHELAHIKHKDHSKRFWDLVERYTPHRFSAKKWLSENLYKADFLAKKPELHTTSS